MGIDATDRWAIQDLMMQYVLANDTGDADGYVNVFAPDGVLVSSDGERCEGHAAIRAHGEAAMREPNKRGRQHHFQTVRIERAGDDLKVFSYWLVAYRETEGSPVRLRSMGATDDVMRRIGGEWKIAHRTISRWHGEVAPWHFPTTA